MITLSQHTLSTLLFLSTTPLVSGIAVTVTPSTPTPAPLGQMITWQANAGGGTSLRYRFRVRTVDIGSKDQSSRRERADSYQMIRDFSTASSLDWTVADHEGMYQMEVSAKDLQTGEIAITSMYYQFLPRTDGTSFAVNPTQHPLVFLFSMPACDASSRVRIAFRTGDEAPQYTPYKPCEPGSSMNFYLAGMRQNTDYSAQALIDNESEQAVGPSLSFHTGAIPAQPWKQTVLVAAPAGTTQPVLLASSAGDQVATDLSGRVIWYNPAEFTWGTRPEAGGYLWGVLEDPSRDVTFQSIQKVDLTGMTVLQTNAETVNEQLAALGKRKISAFHHDVHAIANDRIVALAAVEQILTDVQGPGPVDVVGDMIIVFDRNLNVLWTWDAFDHLDTARLSTTNDKCTPSISACPPFYLAPAANDWTHGNAVQLDPDGSILYSSRHQDWVLKIDYNNGDGAGDVLWKAGLGGDFTFLSTVIYPWFSHQHDPNFQPSNPARLLVFDNGNLRNMAGPAHSRGQVIELDSTQRTARLILNVDLGVLSLSVGSAQALQNGNYHFHAGAVLEGNSTAAYSFEVSPTGAVLFKTRAPVLLYRSFRMNDMYSDAESY